MTKHQIRKKWEKGERVISEGGKYKVLDLYTDYNGQEHIILEHTKKELVLDLVDDRNIERIEKEDKKQSWFNGTLSFLIYLK